MTVFFAVAIFVVLGGVVFIVFSIAAAAGLVACVVLQIWRRSRRRSDAELEVARLLIHADQRMRHVVRRAAYEAQLEALAHVARDWEVRPLRGQQVD